MVIGVLVEIASKTVDRLFDYKVPYEFEQRIKIGQRILVPFANRKIEGFVMEIKTASSSNYDLKEILYIIDEKVVLNEEMMLLGKWLQKRTLAPLISCYQAMLPKALKAKNGSHVAKKYTKIYTYIGTGSETVTKSQEELLSIFKVKRVRTREELQGISKARLDTLVRKGILKEEKKETYRLSYDEKEKEHHALTDKQQGVVDEVLESSDSIFLLHGVTGSGKTEVYMYLIEEALKEGKQSIVLVPEIALTPQMVKRFQRRFGSRIAAFHSALSEGEKYDEWRRCAKGEVDIVIGARSAVFAPLSHLGFIIMDEEHSDSYKQDSTPRYHTRDIALKRGEYHHAKVILGSATPTLESYARAEKKVYHKLSLLERVNGKSLPKVTLVDMHQEIKHSIGHFSLPLIEAMKACFEKKEQVILLLNRRGYASVISCKNCGHALTCPHCDITLTYHKSSQTLRCHYCGYGGKVEKICPECHKDSLRDIGVGTEKIEEELKEIFPTKKVIRMDVDTTSQKGSHEKMVTSFARGDADILLGTQIVAKGLDFANVTLVGVINADTSLMIPDFRSSENTFSLLSQVSGRSGRCEKEGQVIFQTYNQENYAIVCAKENDYQRFYQEEMQIRRMMKYPPYYYLVLLMISGKEQDMLLREAVKCEKVLKKYLHNTIFLGPTPASIFKKAGIYQYQIILKYQYQENLYEILEKLISYYAMNRKVKLDVDFNPLHF